MASALGEEGDSARERIEVTVEGAEGAGATRVKIGIAASAVAAAGDDDVVTAVLAASSIGGVNDFSVPVSISWTIELESRLAEL